MCPEPKISSFPEEPKSPHLLLHESKRCAGEDSFERFVSGFTSLPKPLSEFGRDLAEAVRDEAAEKHRAVKDRATSEGSIANFRSCMEYIRVYKCYRYRKAGLYTQKLGSWDNTGYQKNIGTHHVRHLDPDAPTPGCIPKIRDVRNLIRAGRNAEAQDLCPTGITLRCSE
ncbi:uncharacterized protein LOC9660156 isoform X1 [Selaginella moellendorffii]|uniref:uncharacterized protein LOC9660156 isoform X1 n=1 Tax=Selaginella moellendorffii TaxID=88036 RepID=UPI000D1CD1CF|nr:uncharacterized protein LOC9660156 isoform X1 [Selaginella moellendorffii]|eukprot:XP_024539835.1 uncharacterized protein LOC9660156 isoform X1 [Selaginella moellendorffii]